VEREQSAGGVMAHQPLGIIECVDERGHGGGIAEAVERLGSNLPPHRLGGGGEHLDHGFKPARIGPDLPKGFCQIDLRATARALLGLEQLRQRGLGRRECSAPRPITPRVSGRY
jgi:hypothetical protein